MAIDLKRLSKLESGPPSEQAATPDDDARLLVVIKLHAGAAEPSYIAPRAHIAPGMISAEIRASDLSQLEADPAVQSVSLSRTLPGIE